MSHVHGPGCSHDQQDAHVQISIPDANKAPPFEKAIALYLRDPKKSELKAKQGVIKGKRVEYFQGKRAIKALLKEGFKPCLAEHKQTLREAESGGEEDAIALVNSLGSHGFILRVKRGKTTNGKGTPRVLEADTTQGFDMESYYVWIWEGPQLKLYIGAAGLVAAIFAAVLFPLWPKTLQLGVWYLSVAVLGLMGVFFGIAIVRLILYIITIIVLPQGIWLFPNLFADVGVVDSFIPFWGWDEPKKSSKVSQESASSPPSNAAVKDE